MSDQRPDPEEFPTAFFAKLEHGVLTDGNGVRVGVAVPSAAWPGALMICLDVTLLERLQR